MEAYDIYLIISCVFVYLSLVVSALGCVIPVLPGPLLAAIAVLLFKFGFYEVIGWGTVCWCVALAGISQVLDFLCSWFGAKKFGATWRGAVGAIVGSVVGLLIPPQFVFVFVMSFVGAFVFEYFGGAETRKALNAGVGAFVGSVVALVVKLVATILIFAIFTIELVSKLS